MSDIKLDDKYVIVEGHFLKSATWDFMLDHPDRRKNASGSRRALVHDSSDGLTINYDKDYPGGVTIGGQVRVDDLAANSLAVKTIKGLQLKLECADIVLDNAGRRKSSSGERRALVHDSQDGLTINWGSDYPGGVTINGNVNVPTKLTVAGKDIALAMVELQAGINAIKQADLMSDLMSRLTLLQQEIDSLDARINALEELAKKRIPTDIYDGPAIDLSKLGGTHTR